MNVHGKKSSVNLEIFKEIGWKKRGILFFATWFYTGLIPFAPGTWGSIAALPFAALANSLGPLSSSLSIALMLIVSIPVSGMAAEIMRMEDPSSVVIDEVAGIFVTLFLIPVSWMSVIIGFILFRIFDILKPFPVGLIDKKLHGGTGIVLDDVMAGIYANVGLRLILILVN
jgi:phosphatidylglycerophosphatase A